jgi:thymidylate kinase
MSNRAFSCFICFIGIDGSGKTTHAQALLRALSERNLNVIHVSPRSSLMYLLLPERLRRSVKGTHVRPRNLMIQKMKVFPRVNIFMNFLIVPTLMYVFLTYLLTIKPLLKKFVVVCDRYFYDLLFSLFGKKALLLVGLIPKPYLGILLDLPVDQAFTRMHDMEDKRVPYDFYEKLRKWYIALAKQQGFLIVDSTDEFEKVHKKILNFCIQRLGINV